MRIGFRFSANKDYQGANTPLELKLLLGGQLSPCSMQLLVAFDQPLVFFQAFALHIGWGQAVEAHCAIDRTNGGIQGFLAEHTP